MRTDPLAVIHAWDERAKILARADAHGSDGSGLDDEEAAPSIEEAHERAVALLQKDIEPPRLRHHARQFAVAERRADGEEPSHQPSEHQHRRGVHLPHDVGRNNENATADHGARDQHRRGEQAQFAAVAGGFGHGAPKDLDQPNRAGSLKRCRRPPPRSGGSPAPPGASSSPSSFWPFRPPSAGGCGRGRDRSRLRRTSW